MNRYKISLMALAAVLFLSFSSFASANVTIYPSPDKSLLSADYTMQVDGRDVPVYWVKVAPEDVNERTSTMDYEVDTDKYYAKAAFAYFDMAGSVQVTVTCGEPITSAKLLPVSAAAVPLSINKNSVKFTLSGPGNLTLQVNNKLVQTLHIFANPMESSPPSPKDANVMFFGPGAHQLSDVKVPAGKTIFYFGPGMHTIDNLDVHDGQTVYIAGGAVVRAVIRDGEAFQQLKRSRGTATFNLYKQPAIELKGSGIKLLGRGVLDGSQTLGKYLLRIEGQNISLEGVILQDAGIWTMPMLYSDHVSVSNIKLLGYRVNSDGMDIVSSRDVTVQGCFIRTLDDGITIKTIARDATKRTPEDEARNITVQGTVLWEEGAHALTIGTQEEANVNTITFSNIDIIRGLGRTPLLAVNLSGSGEVGNVRFENIRIDTSGNPFDKGGMNDLIALVINKNAVFQRTGDLTRPLGKMRGVLFRNIQVRTSPSTSKVRIQVIGASDASDIQNVKFENITIDGQPLSKTNSVVAEKFATQVTGLP
jgi:hypothetical protein